MITCKLRSRIVEPAFGMLMLDCVSAFHVSRAILKDGRRIGAPGRPLIARRKTRPRPARASRDVGAELGEKLVAGEEIVLLDEETNSGEMMLTGRGSSPRTRVRIRVSISGAERMEG
jgi:hypothetical protein